MDRVVGAAQHGDRDGEPPVDEDAHARAADREGVEEEGVDEETAGAHEEERAVPFLEQLGFGFRRRPGWLAAARVARDVGAGRLLGM